MYRGGVPFSGPITGQSGCSHLTGRTSNRLISFPGTKQLPLESALFFSLSLDLWLGLAPVPFLLLSALSLDEWSFSAFLSRVAEMFSRELARRNTVVFRPGNSFSKSLRLCAPSSFLPPPREEKGAGLFFFFFKAKPESPLCLCCAGELRK